MIGSSPAAVASAGHVFLRLLCSMSSDPTSEPIRLSKLMAQRGICSRREADEYISRGLVLVDGVPVSTLGTKVLEHQTITLAPAAKKSQSERVTILLNKPVGYVSGQPEKGYHPAAALITQENYDPHSSPSQLLPRHFEGLAPAGRLDIDSRGLLVFTQDGRMAKLLTSDRGEIDKEYIVRFRGEIGDRQLALLRHGLSLDGKPLRPARVEVIASDRLRFELREGRHRQIRRMCEAVQLQILSLMRVRVGRIRLGQLPEGCWRFLRPDESF
jgi:23S rRNA pseudouridine2604 synthase